MNIYLLDQYYAMDLKELTNIVLELERRIVNIEQNLFDKTCNCKNYVFKKCVDCSKICCSDCDLYNCSDCHNPVCLKCANYTEYVKGIYIGKELCKKCYSMLFLSHCHYCCSDINLAKDDICKVCKNKVDLDNYSKLSNITFNM